MIEHWQIEEDGQNHRYLVRRFPLKSYFKGLAFLQTIGWEAQKRQHHPELILNFNELVVKTTTHDEGYQITNKDRELALAINALWF
jgi:4a-hydroxytetrahydrobiopterin dehydratase